MPKKVQINPKQKRNQFTHSFNLLVDANSNFLLNKQVYLIPSWGSSSEILMSFNPEKNRWSVDVLVCVGTHKFKYAYRDCDTSILWMETNYREFTEAKEKRLNYAQHENFWDDANEKMELENLLLSLKEKSKQDSAMEICSKKRKRKNRLSSKKRRALKRRALSEEPRSRMVAKRSRSPSPIRSVSPIKRRRSRWDVSPSPVRNSRWDSSPVRTTSALGRRRSISRSRSPSPKKQKDTIVDNVI